MTARATVTLGELHLTLKELRMLADALDVNIGSILRHTMTERRAMTTWDQSLFWRRFAIGEPRQRFAVRRWGEEA